MYRLLAFIKRNWVVLALLQLVAVTALSLWPLDHLPPFPGSDKTHHLIAYAAVMFPVAMRKPDNWLILALMIMAYSGGIELIQPYVNRYAEWLDLAANCAGVTGGVVVAELMKRWFPLSPNPAP